ncbi:MAG: hypothetical protein ABF649_09820 [Bacillus sp. (in: firmicutes)]
MEKYYCDHCRIIYKEPTICTSCGNKVDKKIKIEVQSQENNKKEE